MTKKKQSESVSTGSDRVLRSQKSNTGDGNVAEKGKVVMPVEVEKKAEGKKSVAKGVKINEGGNSEKAGKRKVNPDKGLLEGIGSPLKRVPRSNEKEKEKIDEARSIKKAGKRKVVPDKGLLEDIGSPMKRGKRSNKNEKERTDEAGNSEKAGKKPVAEKKTEGKAKRKLQIVEENVPSASKSSYSLRPRKVNSSEGAGKKSDEAPNEKAAGKKPMLEKSDAGKKVGKVTAMNAKTDKKKVEANVSSACKSSYSLRSRKGDSVNDKEKDPKGKEILKGEGSVRENDGDGSIPISNVEIDIGNIESPKLKTNLPEPSRRITRSAAKSKDGESLKNTEETAGDASTSQTKKTGGLNRKNPPRKARTDAET